MKIEGYRLNTDPFGVHIIRECTDLRNRCRYCNRYGMFGDCEPVAEYVPWQNGGDKGARLAAKRHLAKLNPRGPMAHSLKTKETN